MVPTPGQSDEEPLKKVNKALEALGLGRKSVEDEGKLAALARKSDSKTEALVQWIKKNLFVNGKLRDDERLLVFTEYKEPLFFLEQRLLQEGFDKNTLRLLYGGMDLDDFEAVKVRIRRPYRRRASCCWPPMPPPKASTCRNVAAGSSTTMFPGRRRSSNNAMAVFPATARCGMSASSTSAAIRKKI